LAADLAQVLASQDDPLSLLMRRSASAGMQEAA
jgi:hypothetical protein